MIDQFSTWVANLPVEFRIFALSIIVTIVGRWLTPRARVKWGKMHGWSFNYRKNETELDTIIVATYMISNQGRGVARNIEITFGMNPGNYNIWPKRKYQENINPDGSLTILLGDLGHQQFIGVETQTIDYEESVNSVIYDGITAEQIGFLPQPLHEKWKLYTVFVCMVVGFSAIIYAFLSVISIILGF